MGKKDEQDLRQTVDEVLFYWWDPIGISRMTERGYWPRGEYRNYVDDVLVLLLAPETNAEQVARYLRELAENKMGLSPGHERNHKDIAETLLELATPFRR